MSRTSVMHTRVAYGMRGQLVTITAEPGPRLVVLGLSEAATREVRVRVESACRAHGLAPPGATVRVECQVPVPPGAADLAVAIAALDACGQLGARTPLGLYGSLGLDGRLRSVRGLYASLADVLVRGIVPRCQGERLYLGGGAFMEADTLGDVVRWFAGAELPPVASRPTVVTGCALGDRLDLLSPLPIEGKGNAVLLVGPLGSGKTLHARRLVAELPRLEGEAAAELYAIYSAAGLLDEDPLRVPFRAPHHTVSEAGLVGARGRPGEVSLAHGGLLFLDEVAEFRRSALDALRVALAQGRAVTPDGRVTPPCFPARPALVVGTCEPRDVERARALFPWTGEIEVERVTVADLTA